MTADQTNQLNRYTVTYAFNGHLRGEYAEAISRILKTVGELHREGVEVEFLGATMDINRAGQPITIKARYEAPTKGTIGWLNYRARLPACGEPQRKEAATTESEDRNIAITNG